MKATNGNGTPVWPGDPAAIETGGVDFRALAHVLGNTCRWGGRSLRFYSVAQHAVTVCTAVQALGGLGGRDRKTLALHALLGDAWRAWLPGPPGAEMSARARENRARERRAIQRAVLQAAGVERKLPESWTEALGLTRRMAEAAVRRDLPAAGIGPGGRGAGPLFPPLRERIRPMHPDRAAESWIKAFEASRPEAQRAAKGQARAKGGET